MVSRRLPRRRIMASISRATRRPEIEVSATNARHSRVQSSTDAYRVIRHRAADAGLNKSWVATSSARPESPPTSKLAVPSKMLRQWRRTKARAPLSSTTAAMMRSLFDEVERIAI